jgi:hypothetical protein
MRKLAADNKDVFFMESREEIERAFGVWHTLNW